MPTYEATVRVTHVETWSVDAADEAEARNKIQDMHKDVDTDDSGGEVVAWETISIKRQSA
jgi:hypothetical protein